MRYELVAYNRPLVQCSIQSCLAGNWMYFFNHYTLHEWNCHCLDEALQQMDKEANWHVIYTALRNSLQKFTYSMNSTEREKFLFCLKTVLQQGFNI
jgi:hypothetical protein